MTNAEEYLKDKNDVIRLANKFYQWYIQHGNPIDAANAKHALQIFLFQELDNEKK